MGLDLDCVEAFVALVGELHYRRTASTLHLSPSALTKRIQKLESELGLRLVDRTPAGVTSLTSAGARFAPHARTLLSEAHAARRAAIGTPAPEFRLGLPGQLRDHPELMHVHSLAASVRRDIPGAVVHCIGVPFPAVTSALLEGRVDVMWDISSANHPGIEAIPLHPFMRIGVISREHAFADATEIGIEEFAQQPMIYGRRVPREWMARFYLDDVRSVDEAQLIAMDGSNSTDVMNSVAMKTGVTVAPMVMTQALAPFLTTVRLIGVPLIPTFASRRRGDNRDSVLRLIHALQIMDPIA